MSPVDLLLLYALFRVKHFICDFGLQAPWSWVVLNKGKRGMDGLMPVFIHSLTHGVGTLVLFLIFLPSFWWFGLVDTVVHAFIDRTKAVLTKKQGWEMTDHRFWWALGLDQEMHNFTHLFYIIFIFIQSGGFVG